MTAALKKGLEALDLSQLTRIPRGFEDLKTARRRAGPAQVLHRRGELMKRATGARRHGRHFAKRSRPLDFG
jgi:hypothetical protein